MSRIQHVAAVALLGIVGGFAISLLLATPALAQANSNSLCISTNPYTAFCCIDSFAGCKRFERRLCNGSTTDYDDHFLSNQTGTCNGAGQCED